MRKLPLSYSLIINNILLLFLLLPFFALSQRTRPNARDSVVGDLLDKLNNQEEIDRDIAIKYLHLDPTLVARENALNAYNNIFHGEIGTINRYDNPAMPVPEEYKAKVMHSQLAFDGNIILCCDAMPGLEVQYGNGIALTITVSTVTQTEDIFHKLSTGGNIMVPLEKQFWGSWFGQVKDRFGITWMLMCEA